MIHDIEAEARDLVAEGWYSTSNKYHRIARWKPPHVKLDQVIRPEFADTALVFQLRQMMKRHWFASDGLRDTNEFVEHAELSPELYAAFRKAGGPMA